MLFQNDLKFDTYNGMPLSREQMELAVESNWVHPAFRDGVITVDKLLDHADVVLDWYVPSIEAIEFFNFIRLVLGEEPENSNPKAHYFLIDCIFQSPSVKPYFLVRGIDYELNKDRIVVMCSREFGKSVLLGTMLPLYMADKGIIPGFGKVNYGLYVSDSMRNNVKTTMETIGSVYRESLFLLNEFEDATTNQDEIKFVRRPRTPQEIALYDEYVVKQGKKPGEVPGRMKRTFAMKGIGASALPLDTKLYTENGITTIGECSVGDKIFGPDGKLATITLKSEIFNRPVYRITLGDGRHLDVCEEHINSVVIKTSAGNNNYIKKNMLTKDLIKEDMYVYKGSDKREHRIFIELCKSFEYQEKNVGIDPYTLGLLLADGSFKKDKRMAVLHKNSDDLCRLVPNIKHDLGYRYTDKRTGVETVSINGIYKYIDEYGLSGVNVYSKFIPDIYKRGSVEQRIQLVKGMMDCGGSICSASRRTVYATTSERLANDFSEILKSLGCAVYFKSVKPRDKSRVAVYKIEFTSEFNPFLLECKASLFSKKRYKDRLPITKIEQVKQVPTQCIGVDNECHQFVAGDYVVTHNTGGRGSREALQRPQFALFDDLIGNEADAVSDAILDNIESTIEKDVLPALHGTKSFSLLIGTPFNKNDPVYRRIEGGMWLPVVFPKAERISIDLKPEEFRGVWPDRHTYEACMRDFKRAWRAKEAGDPIPMRGLMQEYYLRISNDEDRMIQDNFISWFNRDDIASNAWNYNWYITTDFTTTAGAGSDLAGIALWAVSWNGDWFLMDLTLRKLEVEEQYNEVFAMVAQTIGNVRTSVEVGVEVDGQQSLHLIALRERMPKKNIYFTFARQKGAKIGSEGIRSKLEGGNKHWRFRLMLPMFQNHKIHFAKELKGSMDMNELLEEIKYATYSGFGSKHDDGADLISQIGLIEARYPPKVVEQDPKKVNYANEELNAKIWGKRNDNEDNTTVYDSYA